MKFLAKALIVFQISINSHAQMAVQKSRDPKGVEGMLFLCKSQVLQARKMVKTTRLENEKLIKECSEAAYDVFADCMTESYKIASRYEQIASKEKFREINSAGSKFCSLVSEVQASKTIQAISR